MEETQVQSLGQEDPLEKEMASPSNILAWKVPWTVESGGLPSMGLQRAGHSLSGWTHWMHCIRNFPSLPAQKLWKKPQSPGTHCFHIPFRFISWAIQTPDFKVCICIYLLTKHRLLISFSNYILRSSRKMNDYQTQNPDFLKNIYLFGCAGS